jgi:4'-phosphopantetheinyl transferase
MMKPVLFGEATRNVRACSFDLTSAEVCVWRVPNRASEAVIERLNALLSPDERERAARFGIEPLRHTFVIANGALRYLLGRYLDADPVALRFGYGPHGKPVIDGAGIEFNMTRSSGLIACAFARGCAVGIDIERKRPGVRTEEIASRFFTPKEAAEIKALPPDERQRAFFRLWTRKEAYIKATGEGLSGIEKIPGQAWTLHDLNVPPGYAGAIAYSGSQRAVTLQDPLELI